MSLEAQEIAVRLRLLGGTAFEAEAERAAASVKGIGAAGKEANAAAAAGAGPLGFISTANKNLDTVKGKLDKIAGKSLHTARQTAVISAGAAFGIYESVKQFTAADSLFTKLEAQAGATRQQRLELEKTIPVFAKLAAGPKALAEAYYPVQSVFRNVTKDVEVMKTALKVAAIGHDSPLESAEAITSFWKDKPKGIKSVAEAGALLERTASFGKMQLPELMRLTNTGIFQTASAMGVDERSILALIASVSQGVSAGGIQQFATRARTLMTKMVDLKGQALVSAQKLGLDKYTMSEDMEKGPSGLIDIFTKLNEAKSTLGNDKWKEAVSNVFGGARSASAVFTGLTALGANKGIVAELNKIKGEGAIEEMFGKTKKTPEYKFHVMRAEIEELGFKLGKIFTPIVLQVMEKLVGIAKFLGQEFEKLPKPIKSLLIGLVALAALVSPGAFLLAGLAKMGSLALGAGKVLFGLQAGGAAASAGATTMGARFMGLLGPMALFAGALAILTLEAGKHPFNAWEEAFHSIFGGYTAYERETKDREAKERSNFLKKHNAEAASHARHWAQTHPHPLARQIRDPKLRRNMEAFEHDLNRAEGGAKHRIAIVLHSVVNLDGQKIGENRKVVNGVEKRQREHTNRR